MACPLLEKISLQQTMVASFHKLLGGTVNCSAQASHLAGVLSCRGFCERVRIFGNGSVSGWAGVVAWWRTGVRIAPARIPKRKSGLVYFPVQNALNLLLAVMAPNGPTDCKPLTGQHSS